MRVNKRYVFGIIIGVAMCSSSCKDEKSAEAFHREIFVADSHCDTPLRLMDGKDISVRSETNHMDIPRMRESGIDCQVFALWTSPEEHVGKIGWDRTMTMIGVVDSVIRKNSSHLALCRSIREVTAANAGGRIAIMLGVEGGQIIGEHLDYVDTLYDRGVRYITITWENSHSWATSARDESGETPPDRTGLTAFGRQVIRRMDELGMIIDISHSGEKTVEDILETTGNPVIASHSCVYALAPHYRNLKDDQIRAIAERGGVVFINFYSGYLDSNYTANWDAMEDRLKPELDSLKFVYPDSREYRREKRKFLAPYKEQFNPPVDIIIDHIDYIVNLVGADHVGIGSDFDGVSTFPRGMVDITSLPLLTKLLLDRGYSRGDVAKIMGGNFRRVYRKVGGD